jgi:signal transduction histidine kinase
MEPLYSPQSRAERLIAAGRMVLAVASLFAIWFDPTEPARSARTAYTFLICYVLYAIGVAVLVERAGAPSNRQRVITHAVDLAFFSALMGFTLGTANPFIAYFVFAVVCGTLRWQWRGALWTAAASLTCFLGIALYFSQVLGDPDFDLYPIVVRGVYLIVIAVLLGYMGVHEERTRREMALLASWPQTVQGELGAVLGPLLAHAARALGAPRLLLVWAEREEPWLYLATWNGGELSWTRSSPPDGGEDEDAPVAEPLWYRGFLCPDAAEPAPEVLRTTGQGFARWHGAPLAAWFRERHRIRAVIAAPLAGEALEGRLFALDRTGTSDDLVLTEIVAGILAARLDHIYLSRRLLESAAMEERIRLARDLHDGVLQSLTGIGLRVAAIRGRLQESPARFRPIRGSHETREARREAATALEDLQQLITFEQRDLRFFIQELRPSPHPPGPPGEPPVLAFRVTELLHRIELEWGLRAELRAERLGEPPIPDPLAREIYQMIREALVNAARHGRATSVRVEINRPEPGRLTLAVADDGHGFPYHGVFSHAELISGKMGPRNLLERVSSLGGTLSLSSAPAGSRLDISLPCAGGDPEELEEDERG